MVSKYIEDVEAMECLGVMICAAGTQESVSNSNNKLLGAINKRLK